MENDDTKESLEESSDVQKSARSIIIRVSFSVRKSMGGAGGCRDALLSSNISKELDRPIRKH